MHRNYDLLFTPAYLGSLCLLFLNDFFLKQNSPGWITGKLSDFTGLFCLAVFACIVLDRRSTAVNILIAVLFSIWKSPLADPAIDVWNAYMPYSIGRVVDYSDLLALTILPFAQVFYKRSELSRARHRLGILLVALLSCFAFLATSKSSHHETYKIIFSYPGTKDQFVDELKAMHVRILDERHTAKQAMIQFEFPAWGECFSHIRAVINVRDSNGSAEVRLSELIGNCSKTGGERVRLFREFEIFTKRIRLKRSSPTTPSSRHLSRPLKSPAPARLTFFFAPHSLIRYHE